MNRNLLLVVCLLGIYGSFLAWGVFQERLGRYVGVAGKFQAPFVVNLVQNVFACSVSLVYLRWKRQELRTVLDRLDKQLVLMLLCVSFTQSLASSFALASIEHVGYLLHTLTKSCKLLPVMIVSKVVYNRVFPREKYMVAVLVSAGVVLFQWKKSGSRDSESEGGNVPLGALYLACSLLLDGLTNSTQDLMFSKYQWLRGGQLMFMLNAVSVGVNLCSAVISGQLSESIAYVQKDFKVIELVASYSLCGSVGQVFVFQTLEQFGAVVLILATVTRKMLSMVLSCVVFGHRLALQQWAGFLLVFAGIGVEAGMKTTKAKSKAKPKDQ